MQDWKIYFEKAFAPTDIFWEHYGYSLKSKVFRRILSFFLGILYICAGGALIAMIKVF